MKIKIIPQRLDKLWGEELWLSSPLVSAQSKTSSGELIDFGPLIKIISTLEPLSIQVHPDNKLALTLEKSGAGKSESWYVLATKPGTTSVVGLREYDHARIKSLLKTNTFASNLVTTEFKVGDFINIPAGLVHGLGAHTSVLEVQTPSDTTYRYYDYERKDTAGNLRELHLEKALMAQRDLSWKLAPLSQAPLTYATEAGLISIFKTPAIVQGPALVIDLVEQLAYIIKGQERITALHYAVIYPPLGGVWHSKLLL